MTAASRVVCGRFVFEVERPINIHAPLDEHRQLQRRLSMLSALQQETIKLERKQRQDGRGAQLFYKLASPTAAPVPANGGATGVFVMDHNVPERPERSELRAVMASAVAKVANARASGGGWSYSQAGVGGLTR